jgi:hypothetical protein
VLARGHVRASPPSRLDSGACPTAPDSRRRLVRQWLTAGVIGLFAVAFLIVATVPAVSLIATASTVTESVWIATMAPWQPGGSPGRDETHTTSVSPTGACRAAAEGPREGHRRHRSIPHIRTGCSAESGAAIMTHRPRSLPDAISARSFFVRRPGLQAMFDPPFSLFGAA